MKTVVIKSLYSVLSIFLNSFSYLFYSKLSKGYRNIFFKRKIIPSVTKRGGYFKCTNQSFQYFNIHKNIILIYDFLVSTKILYGKYSRCTNINSHQGFYLKAHVKNNACNSFSTFLSPQCFPPKGRKDPSVQSFVATSSRPNICGAVIALGFILISRCGLPQSIANKSKF